MKSIVTLTLNAAIDKSTEVAQVLAEHKMRCHPPRFDPGGGGLNVSRAIHTLGGRSKAIYTCGGSTGQHLSQLLDQAGIDHHPVAVNGQTRENFTAYEQSSRLQYRFGMPGPTLSGSEWERLMHALDEMQPLPDYLVVSGSLPNGAPENAVGHIAAWAKQRNIKCIVDAPSAALHPALKVGVYLIKPNLREFSNWANQPVKNDTQLLSGLKKMIGNGCCEVVVVSLGAAGCMWASADHSGRVTSPTVPILSKVGAGDSMVAAMVLKLSQGAALQDAIRYGVAGGAAAVMTPGSELCRREDVERLFQSME